MTMCYERPRSYIEIGDIIAEQVKDHSRIDGSNCPTHSVINQSADIPITCNYHYNSPTRTALTTKTI